MTLFLAVLFSLLELNCENLFDCRHDEGHSDYEYLPDGARQWTAGKYWKKLNDIGRVVVSSAEGTGRMPDLVALCEVENDSVMTGLTRHSLLRGFGYGYLMTSSPDARGIDVALLYQPDRFHPVRHYPLRVEPLPGMRSTRDILYVAGRAASGDTLHVFVVHAPSRLGGAAHTDPFRMQVARRLLASADSILAVSPGAKILVAGDFNDEAGGKSIVFLSEHGLKDVAPRTDTAPGVEGSYRYKGRWQTIDHVLVGGSLVGQVADCLIHAVPYMIEPDPTYGGIRPKRTYLGGRYLGGCSDHLPLLLQLNL